MNQSQIPKRSPVQQCFLNLLHDSLTARQSSRTEEMLLALTPDDMDRLIMLAQTHSLLPLIGDQLLSLNPPEELREPLRHAVVQATVRSMQVTYRLLELMEAFEQAGVRALVVKGAICRSLYPNPDLRCSSDEDILVHPEDYDRAESILFSRGFVRAEGEAAEAQVHTWFARGIHIELHRSLFGDFRAAGKSVEDSFRDCFERMTSWNVSGGHLNTLCIQDHMLYLILHFYKHFLAGGVGIRQVCDICLFAAKNSQSLCWDALWQELRELSADVLVRNIFHIGTDCLGLNLTAPWADWLPEPDSEALLLDVLDAGVFGASTMERKHSSRMTLQAAADGKQSAGTVRSAAFPSAADLQGRYPYLKKLPWLLPVAWVQRGWKYAREGENVGSRAAASAAIGRQRLKLLERYGLIQSRR